MNGQLIVSAAAFALLTLEALKFVLRKWFLKDPEADFAPLFYELLVPFLTAVWAFGFGEIGWAEPVALEPQVLVQWILAIFAELMMYHMGVEPFKAFRKAYNGA